MKLPYLISNLLNSLTECNSLDSALKLTEAKEVDLHSQLAAVGFEVPKHRYLMWDKLPEFVNTELADDYQFMLDLNTIANALKGNWMPIDMHPEYYDQLKEEIFSVRNNFLEKNEKDKSMIKVGLIYDEIKSALLKRNEPKISCHFNPRKEEYYIIFKDIPDSNASMRERVVAANRIAKSIMDGIGEDTWVIKEGVDAQTMKSLIRNDVFQHPELARLIKELTFYY